MIQSYFRDRTGSSISPSVTVKYVAPQKISVVGTVVFSMYTTLICYFTRNYGLNFHFNADDRQLYIAFQTGNWVYSRTPHPKLGLHPSRQNMDDQQLGDSYVAPSVDTSRNHGLVLFDSCCSLDEHENRICHNENYQLYSIGKIGKYL